jgi:hypothetical protein
MGLWRHSFMTTTDYESLGKMFSMKSPWMPKTHTQNYHNPRIGLSSWHTFERYCYDSIPIDRKCFVLQSRINLNSKLTTHLRNQMWLMVEILSKLPPKNIPTLFITVYAEQCKASYFNIAVNIGAKLAPYILKLCFKRWHHNLYIRRTNMEANTRSSAPTIQEQFF